MKYKRNVPPRRDDPLLNEEVEIGLVPLWFVIGLACVLLFLILAVLI